MFKIEDAVRKKGDSGVVSTEQTEEGRELLEVWGREIGPKPKRQKTKFLAPSSCNRDPEWAWVWHDSLFPTPSHALCDLGGAPDELKPAVGLQTGGPSLWVS